jgi:pimeloyl-ACP methyl ester carboxylesterase
VTPPYPVRYARVGDVSLAYQTWGSGPATIVAVPPLAQNVELTWERPEYRTMLERLGSFAAVLHFDKRGTGASDRTVRQPTIDERVEDLRAVTEAAGFDRTHVLGVSEGGPVALAFAATYPDRVAGVVLMGAGARILGDLTEEELATWRASCASFAERWGTEDSVTLDVFAPSLAADPGYRAWEPRYERQSATPLRSASCST